MRNIYFSPEEFGLEIVGDIEFSDGCYQFDQTVVWRDAETGKMYFADDAGCSCPTPFEVMGRSDLTEIDRPQTLIDHLEKRREETNYYFKGEKRVQLVADIGALVMKVMDARQGS